MGRRGRDDPTFIEQARRRQIVEVTTQILAEEGASAATFARIAERAGISPSLISYHFSSKSALLGQVVSDIVADMDAAILADIGDAPDLRSVIRRLIESQVRYFGDHAPAMVALGRISTAGDPAIAEQLGGHRESTLRELQELIETGQRDGTFGPGPSRPAAVMLLATLEAVPTELFSDPEADAGAYGRALADLFVAALSQRGER